jgi:polysaccharide deacetylase family protein (PEP-CTERM system associated)
MRNPTNILSVDLEEWYHPEYVKCVASSEKCARVETNISKTLDLLKRQNVTATFFIVGELAEIHPQIVDEIAAEGHEIAFHGYDHEPLWKKTPESLRAEIEKFRRITNDQCMGFRAPSFSLNNKTKWALRILKEAGYKYDSSIFPAKVPLYGVRNAPTRLYKPSLEDVSKEDESSELWEFPLLVHTFLGLRIPVAGGFYLRLLPQNIIKSALVKSNRNGYPGVIFFHSWEMDPDTPRLKIGLYKSFVTYHNLETVERRLRSLLSQFEFASFRDYLEKNRLL